MLQAEIKLIKGAGAVILAGGDSKRLGRPKALLEFNGKTLIEVMIKRLKCCFEEVAVVTDKPELYSHLPVRLAGDVVGLDKKNPLRGIHAGLLTSALPFQFVVACDMPFIMPSLISFMGRHLSGCDALVPRNNGYFQPLHAFYSRKCVGVIEEQIRKKEYKITDFFSQINVCYISREEITRFDPLERSFFNVNTWADYKKALTCYTAQTNRAKQGGYSVENT